MNEEWHGKSYVFYKAENFHNYLQACGLKASQMKMMENHSGLCPILKLSKNEDEEDIFYTFTMLWPARIISLTFELGKEFDEMTLDGRHLKTVMTIEGNKLIQTQTGQGAAIITLEFDEVVVREVSKIKDVIGIRLFKRP